MTKKVVERIVQFGSRGALVGIVTEPAQTIDNNRPAIVVLNTGTVHRVGHHRMYVSMSRKLAMSGHTVLRFDFSGIGDSAKHASGQSLLKSNLTDIKTAVNLLESKFRARRVILIGLCSGADHSIIYAHSDPRVIGTVLIDPYIPATVQYFVHYISRRVLQFRRWKRFSFRRSKIVRRLGERISQALRAHVEPQHLSFEQPGVQASLGTAYSAAVAAGIRLLVVCTGRHDAPRQTYREQFLKAYRTVSFGDLLQLEFFEEADHTFSSAMEREKLNDLVEQWCNSSASDPHSPGVSDDVLQISAA
jgi:alpha-beta hydrolase superfamily lysophospholipase